jgi:hypothetical protein
MPQRKSRSAKMETPTKLSPRLTAAQLHALLDMITPERSAKAVAEIARYEEGVTSLDLQARFGVPLGSLAGILASVGHAMNRLGLPKGLGLHPISFRQGKAGTSRYWMVPSVRVITYRWAVERGLYDD